MDMTRNGLVKFRFTHKLCTTSQFLHPFLCYESTNTNHHRKQLSLVTLSIPSAISRHVSLITTDPSPEGIQTNSPATFKANTLMSI